MKLDKFIEETMKQIIDGVGNAAKHAESKGAAITNKKTSCLTGQSGSQIIYRSMETHELIQKIDFDLAVTVQESDKTKGGGGIFVGPFGLGAQGENVSENTSVSRIKFSLPLHLP